MIDELAVTNLGVIGSARIEPGPGLTVISGETGTGKTLLLGALRLLKGAPAGSDQVGPAGREASVEGRFVDADGDELVAARRLVAGGRSRGYLDGRMAPNRLLEDRVGPLVELAGQHDHVLLTRPGHARSMLDGVLDEAGRTARIAYDAAWSALEAVRRDRQALGGDRRELARELETATHQAEEIDAAGFAVDDEPELRARASRLRNAEQLAAELDAAHRFVAGEGGAGDAAGAAVDALRRAVRLDVTLEDLLAQSESVTAELSELAAEVTRRAGAIETSPGALEEVETRLALLADLKRKYGADLAEVLDFGRQRARRAAELAELVERAAGIDAELEAARAAVTEAGAVLADARHRAGTALAAAAIAELHDLGFDDPVVAFDVAPAEPGPAGADRVELSFASDSALAPGPVSRVASGGELSRLVLALRLAAGAAAAPVVAFDEVDAGVGGAVALEVGRKLAALAADRQVLCVTHLPQVAAFADVHVVVDRSGPAAAVRVVAGEDRLEELSRMLSGLPESERGRRHADELLALASGG